MTPFGYFVVTSIWIAQIFSLVVWLLVRVKRLENEHTTGGRDEGTANRYDIA